MPTLAGNKHLSIHFLPHRLRIFHLSTEKVRAKSVRKGHQRAYSRAHSINTEINKKSKLFPK